MFKLFQTNPDDRAASSAAQTNEQKTNHDMAEDELNIPSTKQPTSFKVIRTVKVYDDNEEIYHDEDGSAYIGKSVSEVFSETDEQKRVRK